MKFTILTLGLLVTTNLFANTTLDCVKKVTEFYGLKENTSTEFHGMSNGNKCTLKVSNQKYVSGLNHKESNIIGFNFDLELKEGEIGKGPLPSLMIWTGLSSNEDMQKYSVSTCEIKDNVLTLEYTTKDLFAWKKKHKIALTFSATEAHMTDKESGFWTSGGKSEMNCKF